MPSVDCCSVKVCSSRSEIGSAEGKFCTSPPCSTVGRSGAGALRSAMSRQDKPPNHGCVMTWVSAGRLSGSTCSSDATRSRKEGEPTWRGHGSCPDCTPDDTCSRLPRHGVRPHTISYMRMPRPHRSARPSYPLPLSISGEMYSADARKDDARSPTPRHDANPKSHTRAFPSRSNMMFSGFRSRYSTLHLDMCRRNRTICAA
mmetsp:Transcript_3847/g.12434  ORF Transcript_3847/g.12434 Transcript_3847/m.12434 type:complete len:202 (-) Transcript_3847:742-1347(-)